MKTLKLFNSVIEKESGTESFISEDGFIIAPKAVWAKDNIIRYYQQEKLNGNDLNQTFHKSWSKIKHSSRYELLLEQIKHYVSTYGSNFQAEIYIPNEVLEVPEVALSYKVINAYSKKQMTEKCLFLLKTGIALKEETIDDLLAILVDELSYSFTGDEKIKNKEAIAKLASVYNILPTNTMDFFRYIILMTTGNSLLIKNSMVILAIKESKYNPAVQFKAFGLQKLAEIFNRFKPLFLAYKNKCPKTINKISKLAKKHHKPLVQNPLNKASSQLFFAADSHWLDNATPFALFKALSACYTRWKGQDAFVYRIRNGKSWIKQVNEKWAGYSSYKKTLNQQNYEFLLSYLMDKYDLLDKKIYLPDDIIFALPTSEKMFVGNIPTGTRFYGKKLAVGVYWRNEWGANDLDLSGLNITGKIGWDADYRQYDNLMYSGDITNAPDGAVEYLYANQGLSAPTLVKNNVYSGDSDCTYKIIIGRGDDINYNYMMNPNKLFAEIKCKAIQRQMILGIFIPEGSRQCFTLLNFGAGHTRVSGNSQLSTIATRALYQQWSAPLTFNDLVRDLGAEIVKDPNEADVGFDIDGLERDSFIKIFQ